MLSFLFGKTFSDEEKVEVIAKVRSKLEVEAWSDAQLRRFCIARDWDVDATVDILTKNIEWRKEHVPERSPAVDRVLESGRIRVLRRGAVPIICVSSMWGRLLLDGFSEDDVIEAMVWVLEDVLKEADELTPPEEQAKFITVGTAGPPPKSFISRLNPIFDVSFPERLLLAVVYPTPRWLTYVVVLLTAVLPAKTREKIKVISDEPEFLQLTGLAAEDLPEDLQGGIEASKERRAKAMADAETAAQMPEEYFNAKADADANTAQLMTQVAC